MKALNHLGFDPVALMKRAKQNGTARLIHRPMTEAQIIQVMLGKNQKPPKAK